MRRFLNPAILILTAFVGGTYVYCAWRLTDDLWLRALLAVPFLLVWSVPVVYWFGEREERSRLDHWVLYGAYVAMGWLNFLIVFVLIRDGLLIAGGFGTIIETQGGWIVVALSVVGFICGLVTATRGPAVHTVDVPIKDLPATLAGLRIVQISDLHVGPTIHRPYVARVVALANEQQPDIVTITGDLIDGSVAELTPHVAPLGDIAPSKPRFYITGNHEYYSGGAAWCAHMASLGYKVLNNEHDVVTHQGTKMMMAGIVDPAVRMEDRQMKPDPVAAMRNGPAASGEVALKILLAHNPKLARPGAAAGFDLQLSGHTHAGQFFPWTIVTWFVHKPHYAGLSKQGRMWVYVSAGTGSWGPPIRLGTRPELTVIRLQRAD